MRTRSRTALENAERALQPFYTEGDDGDAIRLALDAVVAAYGGEADEAARDRLLSAVGDQTIEEGITKLYELAAAGEYGAGLTGSAANMVNDLVQDVVEPLIEFVRASKSKSRRGTKGPARKAR